MMSDKDSKNQLLCDKLNIVEDCAGKCNNGGICINGECKCKSGYNGNYC